MTESTEFDTSVVQPARRYNYLLGGKDNFEADRKSAEEILERHPTAKLSALENRWFMHRSVAYMERQGIRQFLDIGTGIPATPNTHDIAQRIDPASRIVYVDNDPIVLAHARALLVGDPRGRTAYLQADLRQPQRILDDPDVRATLDWTEPIGLLLIAVLHFIRDDDDPAAIIGTLVDALPAGSMVVASSATPEYMPAELVTALRGVMERQWRDRTAIEFAELFARPDLELVPPGVQSVSRWWDEDAPSPRPPVEGVASNGLVARVVRG